MSTFEEWQNRKRYPVLTPEIAATIDNDDLVQAIVDHVEDVRLKSVDRDSAEARRIVAGLPPAMRVAVTTDIMDSEIGNGGFIQYFYNGTGRYADLAVEDLRRIGAGAFADVLAKALAVYAVEKKMIDRARRAWFGKARAFSKLYKTSTLGEVDREWYALDGELDRMICEFVCANRGQIRSP